MVDIHCHILPDLDDGPASLEESVRMVHMAAASGTTDIVATPHANLEYGFASGVVDQKVSQLAAASGGAVRIHRGCDFHLYYENVQQVLENPSRYAINQKRYLLVEFGELLHFSSSREILGRLLDAGLGPIITHPERHAKLRSHPHELRQWVKAGCRIQVTAQSITGRFGRRAEKAARDLIEQGLVHFVASDAHNSAHRPPVLMDAYRHVSERYGEACAQLLFVTNPTAALAGEPVEHCVATSVNQGKAWYRFW